MPRPALAFHADLQAGYREVERSQLRAVVIAHGVLVDQGDTVCREATTRQPLEPAQWQAGVDTFVQQFQDHGGAGHAAAAPRVGRRSHPRWPIAVA